MAITYFRRGRWHSLDRQRRQQQQRQCRSIYIPTMADPSSSSSRCCLISILFGFCLAFIVILAAAVIYHLNSSDSTTVKSATAVFSTAMKRQLPSFVNVDIDPCEDFYSFVCDKWIRKGTLEFLHVEEEEEFEQKWTRIRYETHDKLMTNISSLSANPKNYPTLPIYRFYQLCEKQSPVLLLDELERHFANLRQQEPYRTFLTLFSRTRLLNKPPASTFFLLPNPFFRIIPSSSNSSVLLRASRRPLPSPLAIFPNQTLLNRTAFDQLLQFDANYLQLLSDENHLIKPYEQEYNQDSLILKRILSFPNYHLCLPYLTSHANTNGLEQLIELLNHFLHSRLHNFNKNSIDKQIRALKPITDNHTLVNNLRKINLDLKAIEQIVVYNQSDHSCIINLLDRLLDKRMKSTELSAMINLYALNRTEEYFISNDWPFLTMLNHRLLNRTTSDTLVNFAFFDSYRQFLYPYYQPHIGPQATIYVNHSRELHGYTYQMDDSNTPCHIQSCFDILNCYHPSLLNQVVEKQNQTYLKETLSLVQNLLDRFRMLTEQSDHLLGSEKRSILHELNQIQISIGHFSSPSNISLSNNPSTYLDYVQFLSSIPYDRHERSYDTEPIYYPWNHTLFLPFGFLSRSNNSLEYYLVKLLLKILRSTIQSNPYRTECLLKSSGDDDQETMNNTETPSTDEEIVYLLLRAKFLSEQKIISYEYLLPFMSASTRMEHFLIGYTANHYCTHSKSSDLFRNNTYLNDDVHLTFHCQQAGSIKQSKCTVN